MGCNEEQQSVSMNSKDMEFPTVKLLQKDEINLNKATIEEINAIKNSVHVLSWAYYQETRTNKRWYISSPSYPYIFSLMPIIDGQAGWAGVSLDAGSTNLDYNTISIGDIPSKTDCSYYDYGLSQNFENCIIQNDIELIRNSTVPILWWFFQAPNENWYIMREGSSTAYMFAGNAETGDYDWSHSVDVGIQPTLFVENGVKKMKFESTTQTLFDLNTPLDEQLNFPKVGCSFSDISVDNEYYPFATALCQSNIDLGDSTSSYAKFEPNRLATWDEVLNVANYSKDYDGMLKECTQTQYLNNKSQCHLDFAQNLGFNYALSDNITLGEMGRYLYKLFYNQELTEIEAIDALFNKGIISNKENTQVTRGEMAKVILSIAGVYRKELKNEELNLPSLPYGLNAPTVENPLVDIELPSISQDNGIKIVDILDINRNNEGVNRKVILPLPSIAKPATIDDNISTLSDKVIESAKENVGKKEPFVDATYTHDMMFVNTVLGLPTIHKDTQEMVDEYKNAGKTTTLAEATKGDVVVYKSEASSNNLPHIAIISDETKTKEIGLPNIGGVQETTIVPEQVDVVIPLESLNLPTIANTDYEDIHSSSRSDATYINGKGWIYGKITKDDSDLFQIALQEGISVNLDFDVGDSTDVAVRDSYYYGENSQIADFQALTGVESRRFTPPKTGLYYIRIEKQGNFVSSYDYKFSLSCGDAKEACPNVGDYDSVDNPIPLSNGQTFISKIDYQGDVDYYTFEVLNDTNTGKVHVKDLEGNNLAVIIEDESGQRYNDVTGTWGGYLKKGVYLMQVRWINNVDTGSYTVELDY